MTPKAQTTKTKIEKWEYIKLKVSETINKMTGSLWNGKNIYKTCI
jgi:hypothetical protein